MGSNPPFGGKKDTAKSDAFLAGGGQSFTSEQNTYSISSRVTVSA